MKDILHPASVIVGIIAFFSFAGLISGCQKESPVVSLSPYADKLIAYELDLDEYQIKQLEQVKSSIQDARNDMRDFRSSNADHLADLVLSDSITSQQVQHLIEQRMDHMHYAIQRIRNEILSFHASLDQNQKERVADFIKRTL